MLVFAALARAAAVARNWKVDLINLSYGEYSRIDNEVLFTRAK